MPQQLKEENYPPLESENAAARSAKERAFPQMLHDLQVGLVPQVLQQKYRSFLADQNIEWMMAELSFLNTHTIDLQDCGQTRRVNAFAVGFHSAFFNSLFKYSELKTVKIWLDWLGCIAPGISAALTAVDLRGCHVEVTDETCLQLFMAADFMLCEQLRSRCLKFIRIRCFEDSLVALTVWNFARSLHLPDLVDPSLKCVLRNFQDIRGSSEFLDLDADAVREILDHRMLNCASELQVLQTVSEWARHRPETEQRSREVVEQLLCCVRLSQMLSSEFATAQEELVVTCSSDYLEFLSTYPLPTAFSARHEAALERSRPPRWPQQVLLLLCGWYKRQGPTALCQVYDPRADNWDLRSPDRRHRVGWLDERSHACCVLLGNVMHLVAGYSGADALKSVLCFDRKRPQLGWYEGSCLLQPRYYHCCAALNGFLYTIGGQTAERRLTHVERMRAADNSWVAIDSLRKPRCEAAAVAFRDKVLVVGGFDGRVHLDTAEMYCPTVGSWTLITGYLTQPRTGLGLVVHAGAAFAMCGRNAGGWRSCVERTEDGRTWRTFCEMTKARSNFGYSVMDDRVYLFGGICGPSEKEIVASVEWFEPKQKTLGSAHPMPFPASGLTACVLNLEPEDSAGGLFCPAPLRLLTPNVEAPSASDDTERATTS